MKRLILVPVLLALAGPARADSASAINPVVSAAAESSHVVCTAHCFVRSGYVTIATAVSGFLMSFDATSAPADGAVTPRECISVAGPATLSFDFGTTSEAYSTGLTLVFSTTGCFTKTASATAYFHVMKQ